ncbi:hypothetical protein CALVIDRAFT_524672 [Calocera viscosa TUFC12733]|uniref:Uncharacterized protein n=1 Tax=Calocera viscosa (strain TUFC12733) TaxID=1330018 RepID=A0A167RJU0_CALVF|nr:hypothetical protein CALVIDRAFT_524672 [Calocera viscosa TUFC12733]
MAVLLTTSRLRRYPRYLEFDCLLWHWDNSRCFQPIVAVTSDKPPPSSSPASFGSNPYTVIIDPVPRGSEDSQQSLATSEVTHISETVMSATPSVGDDAWSTDQEDSSSLHEPMDVNSNTATNRQVNHDRVPLRSAEHLLNNDPQVDPSPLGHKPGSLNMQPLSVIQMMDLTNYAVSWGVMSSLCLNAYQEPSLRAELCVGVTEAKRQVNGCGDRPFTMSQAATEKVQAQMCGLYKVGKETALQTLRQDWSITQHSNISVPSPADLANFPSIAHIVDAYDAFYHAYELDHAGGIEALQGNALINIMVSMAFSGYRSSAATWPQFFHPMPHPFIAIASSVVCMRLCFSYANVANMIFQALHAITGQEAKSKMERDFGDDIDKQHYELFKDVLSTRAKLDPAKDNAVMSFISQVCFKPLSQTGGLAWPIPDSHSPMMGPTSVTYYHRVMAADRL